MSNRILKVHLWNRDPKCHWCRRETILTNIQHIKGDPEPLMATVDHLISRYSPARWVRRKKGEVRKVLACFECNHRRAEEETEQLSKEALMRRGQGFTLNQGIKSTFPNVEAVVNFLKEKGIDIPQECDTVTV